jgi:CheY-like chemotaxis protein
MARVRLLHWKASEAGHHIEVLRQAGYQVDYEEQFRPALMKEWRESPPDAFVVDLSRLPSDGREIAIALRQSPRTRYIPVIFCGGKPEKVAGIRDLLPDASYSTLEELCARLRKALTNRRSDPVKPVQMMDRYGSRTAAQKLGINECSRLRLIDPPRNVMQVLGELPSNVEVLGEDSVDGASVTLCFVRERQSLLEVLSRARPLASASKFWVLWRKGGSTARGDVTETQVRNAAIDIGLVDYKVCSVNDVWSAMLFAVRRSSNRN